MGTGRANYAASTSGTQTAYLAAGGGPDTPAYTANTEHWNGSAWTEVANLATAVANGCSAGTTTSALSATGRGPGNIPFGSGTEEWTTASTLTLAQEGQVWDNTTSTVLKGYGAQGTGAWASGTVINTARGMEGGVGTQTSAIIFGGHRGPASGRTNVTETYDGTTWTNVNNMLAARDTMAAFGTQTAALGAGGEPGTTAATETWDGTSWSEVNDLNESKAKMTGFGTTASGMGAAGNPSSYFKSAESWDGTCWTTATSLSSVHSAGGAGGVSNSSGIVYGGEHPPTADTEEWDGSTWTEKGNLNLARYSLVGSGTATAALAACGTPNKAETELWDGTAWTEVADLANAGSAGGGTFNSSISSLVAGGYNRPSTVVDFVEEWSVPDAIKTFTAS